MQCSRSVGRNWRATYPAPPVANAVRACGPGASGVAAGDRVALLVTPGTDLTVALYACLRIGGPSAGAEAMVAIFRQAGRPVHRSLAEVPGCA